MQPTIFSQEKKIVACKKKKLKRKPYSGSGFMTI